MGGKRGRDYPSNSAQISASCVPGSTVTCRMLGRQQTAQSSTYRCAAPALASTLVSMTSPQKPHTKVAFTPGILSPHDRLRRAALVLEGRRPPPAEALVRELRTSA